MILVYSAVLSAYVYKYVALHIRHCLRCNNMQITVIIDHMPQAVTPYLLGEAEKEKAHVPELTQLSPTLTFPKKKSRTREAS